MNDNDIPVRIKLEMLGADLQKTAEEVLSLVSPLNAVSLYAQYLMEDCDGKDIEDSLASLDKAARKCITIVKRLSKIMRPYLKYRNRRLR